MNTKLVLMASLSLAACHEPHDGTARDAESSGGSQDSEGDASEGDESTGGEPDDPTDGCESSVTAPLRRLTSTEYRNAVFDLLGVDASDLVAGFPVDATIHGFANNAAVQSLRLEHARAYQDAAEEISDRLLSSTALRDAVLGCTPTGAADDACVRAFVESFAQAAYRRPVSNPEVEALLGLAATSDTPPYGGVALVVRTLLQSPHFLFRIERGQLDPDEATRRRLDGYEIAARLSFFLWQTTPDPWLMAEAAAGTLDTAEGVLEVTRTMLESDAVQATVADFATGWLRLSSLDDLGRNPQSYPEWGPALRDGMQREVIAMVTDATLGGGTLDDLYQGRRIWLTPELAAIYGLPAVAAGELVPTVLPAQDDRGGLLGTAAMLALTTPNDVTSPVRRGMFVWDALLCSPLPPPPAGVIGELPPPEDQPKADALEAHRSDPECAACHDQLDPIGLGLERYDALGRRRSIDEGGYPVVEQGSVPGLQDSEFGGAGALGALMRELPAHQRCFATQTFRWALGRSDTTDDACTIDALDTSLTDSEGDWSRLVETLVTADAFRYRNL